MENIFKSGTFNPLILGVNFEHGVLISAGEHCAPNTLKRCLPEGRKHQYVWCPLETLCWTWPKPQLSFSHRDKNQVSSPARLWNSSYRASSRPGKHTTTRYQWALPTQNHNIQLRRDGQKNPEPKLKTHTHTHGLNIYKKKKKKRGKRGKKSRLEKCGTTELVQRKKKKKNV